MQNLLSLGGFTLPEWERALVHAGLAVWDVIASREFQEGSMGHAIRGALLNDIPGFITSHPTVGAICLNGKKARDSFSRLVGEHQSPSLEVCALPSTSPANAHVTLKEKQQKWEVILKWH